ncbi:MAG: hypothetical protein GY720_21485 [bacterium]|nr:hypothetical protein [bacterium]
MNNRTMAWISFLWGMFEAVVFFVIPDVILTALAARYGIRRALFASLWAVAGAVIGGLIAYTWGELSASTAATYMEWLPGVDLSMINGVASRVAGDGPGALLSAPLRGEPYKLYAAASGSAGASWVSLALWTVPGRLWRFVALSLLFGGIRTGATKATGRSMDRALIVFWAIFWLAVYTVFWSR